MVVLALSKDVGAIPTNTYPGRRCDLLLDDDHNYMDKESIKKLALATAMDHQGVTAYLLSSVAFCSKEWARKILNQMHKDGQLTCRKISQLNLFGLPDIPCPHCGESMSAYIRNGACTVCSSYGGGR